MMRPIASCFVLVIGVVAVFGCDATVEFRNVQEFKHTRPDVTVVEYDPFHICLGSFWLIP